MNNFIVINNGIYLSINCSLREEGNTYAFYLYFKDKRETHFYSKKYYKLFSMPLKNGNYRAIFFIKNKGAVTTYEQNFQIKNGRVIRVAKKIIYEDNSNLILSFNIESKKTFIVFNGAGTTKKSKPFGLDYLLSKGVNVIACLHNNNQYQGLSYEKFQEIITPLVKDCEVTLYGSSLGGYCSLYYAGAVNGQVIAAAPRNSAHPKCMEVFYKHWFSKINYTHNDIANNQLTTSNVNIIIDPLFKEDVYFFETFIKPAYPKANVIEVPSAGHEVLFHLNITKQLDGMIEEIILGKLLKQCEYLESEFTLYNKAYDSFLVLRDLFNSINKKPKVNPLIEKKLKNLKIKLEGLLTHDE